MSYKKEALIAYIGNEEKAQKFEELFNKYDKNPKTFVFWWPAFLFGFWYLFYRRAFFEGAIWFAAFAFLPVGGITKLIISTILGTIAIPMILHRRHQKVKKEVEDRVKDKAARIELLKEKGGIRNAAIVIPTIIAAAFIFTMAQFSSLIIGMTNAKSPQEMSNVIITYTEKNVRQLNPTEKETVEKKLTETFTRIKDKTLPKGKAEKKLESIIRDLWFTPTTK